MRPLAVALLVLMAVTAHAQSPASIRVSVEMRQAGTQGREGAGARGGVIVTERGGVRPRGGITAGRTETRSQRTTGVFTLVPDGGEASLVIATQVPIAQIAYFRDYATGQGYVAAGVTFRDVGTSLRVRAQLLPDRQIRVRLTPSISWVSADGSGTIEFIEASTEIVVRDGQPVVVGGGTAETSAVTREVLGIGREHATAETTIVLTARVQR